MPSQEFLDAVARSKELPAQGNQSLLQLYALYKQATEGDVSGAKPSRLNLRARAKYEAWEGQRGLHQEAAASAYVALVAKLGGA
ncbi:MAG: acyl-CoA-binding protein [Deltaproteobacteria bacterium]|nr:acyl-CoA-binding protein [Deltaproteobacteria bacterium]